MTDEFADDVLVPAVKRHASHESFLNLRDESRTMEKECAMEECVPPQYRRDTAPEMERTELSIQQQLRLLKRDEIRNKKQNEKFGQKPCLESAVKERRQHEAELKEEMAREVMQSGADHPLQAHGRLEDFISYDHLRQLELIFKEKADQEKGGEEGYHQYDMEDLNSGLDMKEFQAALTKVMGCPIDPEDLKTLFVKIDSSCDGNIDWNELISFMVLEYQEKDVMVTQAKELPFPKPLRDLPATHREDVCRLTFFQLLTNRIADTAVDKDNPGGRYMSMSKDGQLCVYSIDFELMKSVSLVHQDTLVSQWLTDLTTCPNVNMVAVSSTEREISFYDYTANKFDKQFQMVGFQDAILCMHYWFDHGNLNHATLVTGSTSGTVIVFRFEDVLRKGLFHQYPQKGTVKKVALINFIKHMIPGANCLIYPRLHGDWVSSVMFYQLAQGLDCFISCSGTDDTSMYLGDLNNIVLQDKWPGFTNDRSNRSTFFRVRKGITTLDYSKEWNVIVTGGYDAIVRTWNPYGHKAPNVIKGHLHPITQVRIIPAAGQVITVAKSRMIRIIELRDHTTTQVIQPRLLDHMTPLNHPFGDVFYQKRYNVILLGTSQVGLLEGYEEKTTEDEQVVESHTGPVSAVLYNSLFHQVVTGGHDSLVQVWNLDTGVKSMQFHTAAGVELTCMCFDETLRKLVTGSRNGAVRVWNFNNGACLRTLTPGDGLEVTDIVCVQQKIVVSSWNKQIGVYRIAAQTSVNEEQQTTWKAVHVEDVLSVASYRHNNGVCIVASSSYDGDIYIWAFDTGQVLCRLNRKISFSPLSSESYKNSKYTDEDIVQQASDTTVKEAATEPTDDVIDTMDNIASPVSVEDKGEEEGDLPDALSPDAALKRRLWGSSAPNLTSDPNLIPRIKTTKLRFDPNAPLKIRWPKRLDNEDDMPSPSTGLTRNARTTPPPPRVAPAPSVGIFDKRYSMEEHTRFHLDIITGLRQQDYWESDVSVDKLLFLQTRAHKPNVATLVACGSRGWVHGWSVHPQGGLLGQFVAAHHEGESVLAIATDARNSLLITGDSQGFIKVWRIKDWCYHLNRRHWRQKIDQGRRETEYDLVCIAKELAKMDEENIKTLSRTRARKLRTTPPPNLVCFRAHNQTVNDIQYINDQDLILTCSNDSTVRLWEVHGAYIGTFGRKQAWCLTTVPRLPQIPPDLKRVASKNTLDVLGVGKEKPDEYPAQVEFKALKQSKIALDKMMKQKVTAQVGQPGDVEPFLPEISKMTNDDELEKSYQRISTKLKSSSILGSWYKPKRRHRALPKIEIKTHQRNFHVHSELHYSEVVDPAEMPIPEVLREKWKRYGDLQEGRRKNLNYPGQNKQAKEKFKRRNDDSRTKLAPPANPK